LLVRSYKNLLRCVYENKLKNDLLRKSVFDFARITLGSSLVSHGYKVTRRMLCRETVKRDRKFSIKSGNKLRFEN